MNENPVPSLPDELSSEEMAALADFDCELSESEAKLLEGHWATPERQHQHRLCVVALSSSSAMLKNLRRESPEEFDVMLDALDAFQEQARLLAELSERAFSRMLIVGSLTEDELQD